MKPIRLEVEVREAAVTVRVVGSSDDEFRGRFVLHMSGNGNRSTHQGTFSLAAGEKAILSNVTLAGAESWDAVLEVEADDGARYEERASNPA